MSEAPAHPQLPSRDTPLPLPDTGLAGLEALINGDLWHRWAGRHTVFPLHRFRDGVRYVRLKPGTSCRLAVFGDPARSPADPPPGFLLYLFPDLDRARVAFRKAVSRPLVIGPDGYQPFLCESSATVGIPFPNDPKIPGLRHAYRPSRLRRAIVAMLPEFGAGSAWSIRRDIAAFDLLNYKPERRAVYRLTALAGRDGTKLRRSVQLHVKLENPTTAARSFANLETIHAALPKRAEWYVPRPRGTVVERSMMAVEWIPGDALSDQRNPTAFTPDVLRRTGRALGGLHGLDAALAQLDGADREADRLRALGHDLAAILPDEEGRILELAEQLAEERLALPDDEVCPLHGDFHLGQVLDDNGRIVLVDFDRAGLGLAESDLGSFLAHLAESAPSPSLAHAFVSGYSEAAGRRPNPEALRVTTACATFRRSIFPFRGLAADWPEQVRRQLDRAAHPPLF